VSDPSRAEVIARGAVRLSNAGVPGPERDARLLYRWAANLDGAGLSAVMADPAPAGEADRFEQAIKARAEKGWMFGIHTTSQMRLATLLHEASPCAERVVF